MTFILNIETATEVCSVAIADEGKIIGVAENDQAYKHTADITILIQKALLEAGISLKKLDAVAVSSGPGSYTALRVGTSVAKGICHALSIPLIEIPTLQSLAFACAEKNRADAMYAPMIDARRMEVYTAVFDNENKFLTEAAPMIISPESFNNYFTAGQTVYFCGNGSEKCIPVISSPRAKFCEVKSSAIHMSKLSYKAFKAGKTADLAYFSPNYIKPPNITKPKKRL